MSIIDELREGEIQRKEELVVKSLEERLNPHNKDDCEEGPERNFKGELDHASRHIEKLEHELNHAKLNFEAEYERRVFIEKILRKIIE